MKTLSTLARRRIAAGVVLIASLGTAASIGPISVSMLSTDTGQFTAVVAVVALAATFSPKRRLGTAFFIAALTLVAVVDVAWMIDFASAETTIFGTASPGWGLLLQIVASAGWVGYEAFGLVSRRRRRVVVTEPT